MSKQAFFIPLLLLLGILCVVLVAKVTGEIVTYFTLNQQKELLLKECQIVEKKHQFFLIGTFETGEILLKGPLPNRYVAEAEIRKFHPPQPLLVWCNPHNLKEVVLNRNFPKKRVTYLFIVVGLGLYFIFLKKRVEIFSKRG